MRDSRAYRKALMAEVEEKRKEFAERDRQWEALYSYVDDPDISEHDKRLQGSLDCEMEHPDDALKRIQAKYAAIDPSASLYTETLDWSVKEEMLCLEQAMSAEAIAEREENYARYLELQKEALAKGFVRHGNCKNVRRRNVY